VTPGAIRRGVFALLRRVEDEELTGVLDLADVDERAAGRVMAARGRLCFVAPAAGQTPIGTLLAGPDEDTQRRLDQAALDARRRGVRLCEALLDSHALDLEALRTGLRRQAAWGLVSMTRAAGERGLRTRFSSVRDDYDHRLTFSALDVFTHCSAMLDDAPEDLALHLFCEYAPQADAALLMLRPADAAGLPLPVAVRGGLEHASLRDVVALARSALAMLHPAALAYAGQGLRVCSFVGPGGVWVGASGAQRLTLLRTGPGFEAGQMLGLALRLARRNEKT
jgi:hypothetical protein